MKKCYCGSNQAFEECCQPIINGTAKANTSEALMRSRYTAFVIADINYLMNSHHKSTRPTKERKSILKWTKSVNWISLNIISTKSGTENDTEGWVEFKAVFTENKQIQDIHENSYFVKENNTWYYKSGDHK